jgi:hypothetical protein
MQDGMIKIDKFEKATQKVRQMAEKAAKTPYRSSSFSGRCRSRLAKCDSASAGARGLPRWQRAALAGPGGLL